jgi:hypothetical protein
MENIEDIVDKLKCSKGFECYKSGFKNLCKAEDIGIESFLVCLEKEPSDCKFSIPFGDGFFCQCPLRVYIAKKMKV